MGVHEVRVLELAASGRLLTESSNLLKDKDREILFELHKKANAGSELPRVMVFPYLEQPEFLGCTGGFHHITIDAQGNVCPCPFTPLSFGNVVHEPVEEVLERLKKHFPTPSCKCLNTEYLKKIRNDFDGKLPLSYKESAAIVKEQRSKEIPTFYRKLGLK